MTGIDGTAGARRAISLAIDEPPKPADSRALRRLFRLPDLAHT